MWPSTRMRGWTKRGVVLLERCRGGCGHRRLRVQGEPDLDVGSTEIARLFAKNSTTILAGTSAHSRREADALPDPLFAVALTE